MDKLQLNDLKNAIQSGSAAFRCRMKLRPVGHESDKVFPPTYAGGVYAVEDRRIEGRVVRCVLLDSVQSQANRMEEALQEKFLPDWRGLPQQGEDPPCDLPVIAVYINNHGWVTSLTAPHRIHDAILRDSNLNGIRFRDSSIGREIVGARLHDATAFYRYCPTALLFGTWDSTAGEGLNAAKIPRAVVSEIIGVDMTPGIRTASRIDPLGIERMSLTFYRKGKSGWTFEEPEADKKYKKGNGWTEDINQAEKDGDGKPKEEKPIEWGKKPSDINHGNVTPNIPRFEQKEIRDNSLGRLADILESNPVKLRLDLESSDGRVESHTALDRERVRIRAGSVKPGGVTMAYALHTWVLSLTQLRRLRFGSSGNHNDERNAAARTVLAALAIYALALQREQGFWLRSRCELVPYATADSSPVVFEQIKVDGTPVILNLPSVPMSRQLLTDALSEAENAAEARIAWERRVIRLTPTEELKRLVGLSDGRAPGEGDEESAVAEDASDQD